MSTAAISPPKRRPLAAGLAPANYRVKTSGASPDANADTEPEIQVLPPKLAAIEQLGDCEDDISWEELIECLEIREMLDEPDDGLCYTQEEMEARVASWFK